ncbi:hypothetical protein EVAR_38874_1 [Eumeta japonica]|uniref:Uncharacterized protein n=1 Tax=Eumeta variegata TaxID=151549 RepID=A0A4C1X8Q4_EUMVA|nr:hypothetical protein EVAR_38874_1 [Eumeta japonica]
MIKNLMSLKSPHQQPMLWLLMWTLPAGITFYTEGSANECRINYLGHSICGSGFNQSTADVGVLLSTIYSFQIVGLVPQSSTLAHCVANDRSHKRDNDL